MGPHERKLPNHGFGGQWYAVPQNPLVSKQKRRKGGASLPHSFIPRLASSPGWLIPLLQALHLKWSEWLQRGVSTNGRVILWDPYMRDPTMLSDVRCPLLLKTPRFRVSCCPGLGFHVYTLARTRRSPSLRTGALSAHRWMLCFSSASFMHPG